MTRIIIAGSRDFNNYELLCRKCNRIISLTDVEIVSGHCRGADKLGERFASEHHIPLKLFPADWDTYGKRAGMIRNEKMAKYAAEADHSYLVAFPIGKSPGTRNMISVAKRYGLTVYVVEEIDVIKT